MRITTVNLPEELTDRIDQVARDSERSRSFVIRRLLETALTAQERLDALNALSAQGLAEYADNAKCARGPNATEIIAASSTEGHARLRALGEIAAGSSRKATS
jgi:predicted transcriptional regulator